jgi:lipopolysaccharide biosynthesis glycosyltransferase
MTHQNKEKINILVTLDKNYIPYLNVMLTSLLYSNQDCCFDIYLLHSNIPDSSLTETQNILGESGELIPVKAKDIGLDNAPTTSRYPQEIYYRIFAAKYLPDTLDRILYLDPDIIVNGSLKSLYSLPMDKYYFAAASHTGALLRKINELRLDMDEECPYINSGVMLMNLKRLRAEQNYEDVFDFIKRRKNLLILHDQDIISSLYGSKILELDTFRYNMTENLYVAHAPFEKGFDLDWVRKNSVIIHYCGRNKPWKSNYIGQLNIFYNETVSRMKKQSE